MQFLRGNYGPLLLINFKVFLIWLNVIDGQYDTNFQAYDKND